MSSMVPRCFMGVKFISQPSCFSVMDDCVKSRRFPPLIHPAKLMTAMAFRTKANLFAESAFNKKSSTSSSEKAAAWETLSPSVQVLINLPSFIQV